MDAEAAFPLLLPGSLGEVHQRLWRGASGRVGTEGHFSRRACAGVAACPPLLLPLLCSECGLGTSRAQHPAHLVPVSFHSLPPLASGSLLSPLPAPPALSLVAIEEAPRRATSVHVVLLCPSKVCTWLYFILTP